MTNYGGESARIITAVKIYTSTCEVVGIDDPGEGGVLHLYINIREAKSTFTVAR